MRAFFFGDSPRQLYGVYHAPRRPSARPRGLVICPPFGQEYMRSHRALRQLANQLARVGCHVLRFDYFGTGDSAGNGDEFTLEGAAAAVRLAVDELRDMSGLSTVTIVGLRLGATIACRALAAGGVVAELVLWDPVVSGPAYKNALLDLCRRRHQGPRTRTPGVLGIEGFPLTPMVQKELQETDLTRTVDPRQPLTIVASAGHEDVGRLISLRRAIGAPTDVMIIDASAGWDDEERLGAVLMPQAAIGAIVSRFDEVASHA